jgi:AcrR family transcriptional regulator
VDEQADKRTAIVAAALEVIEQDGLSGFTQPRVARRTGLRQSHLTYYFPTRSDLLLAVADEAIRRRIESLTAVLGAPTPQAKVRALVDVLVDPRQTRVLTALTQSADAHPGVRAAFATLGAGIAPLGVDLIRSFDAEPDEASLVLLQATSTGLAVLALASGGGPPLRARAEHVLTRLLVGLRCAPNSSAAGATTPDTDTDTGKAPA